MEDESRTKADLSSEKAFLSEIRRLRGAKSDRDGEDWIDRAIDMRTFQLLALSESLRDLESEPALQNLRRECDGIVDDLVTRRLEGSAAIDQTEQFLGKAATLLLERAMGDMGNMDD